jgi:hypothetical protein
MAIDALLLANASHLVGLTSIVGYLQTNLGSEIALIAIICAVLLIIFVVIKRAMRSILAILLNSILGIAALVFLSSFVQMIPMTVYTLIIALLFGLPGVGTLVILKLFGVSLIG